MGEEGISSPRLLATSCSANTMNIVLRVVWVVKVDDKFHVFNICKIMLKCGTVEMDNGTKMYQSHNNNQIKEHKLVLLWNKQLKKLR